MHCWPAWKNAAYAAASTAVSRSASSSTMNAFLPPSSSVTFFSVAEAAAMIALPTAVEPVKETLSTSGWLTSASPVPGPGPWTTLTTPGGTPASRRTSASSVTVAGVSGAGLTTTVHPAASAIEIFQAAICSGKFHGITAATTPTGSWRRRFVLGAGTVLNGSTSGASSTGASSAIARNHRIELPTSTALALATVEPASRVSQSASSAARSRSSWATHPSTAARSCADLPDQRPSSKAARAAATARSTSSGPPSATVAMTSPVEGSTLSNSAPEAASQNSPSMKSWKVTGWSPGRGRACACGT